MGPILALGISQPSPATVTHPPWIAVLLLRVYTAGLKDRTGRHQAGFEIAPQSNQELARHGHDGDAARPPLESADAFSDQMLKALSG